MTHAALSPLIGSEFDDFLGASIGEDQNETGLTVLSAFARLNVDPWQEATSLARMPRNAAVVRLNALINALPSEPAIEIPGGTIAADLVALLPRDEKLNVRTPHNVFAAARSRQTHILITFSTFLIILFTVFLLSSVQSPGSGNRTPQPAPRGEAASTGTPHR
jgi:hypothetical protein